MEKKTQRQKILLFDFCDNSLNKLSNSCSIRYASERDRERKCERRGERERASATMCPLSNWVYRVYSACIARIRGDSLGISSSSLLWPARQLPVSIFHFPIAGDRQSPIIDCQRISICFSAATRAVTEVAGNVVYCFRLSENNVKIWFYIE